MQQQQQQQKRAKMSIFVLIALKKSLAQLINLPIFEYHYFKIEIVFALFNHINFRLNKTKITTQK